MADHVGPHLVVDGNNILMRSVKVPHAPLITTDGIDTGALHIFITSMAKHVRDVEPSRMAACWDGGRSEYRLGLYPAYKANRPVLNVQEREDRATPFSQAKEFLAVAGIHQAERPGVEADDLIASYWWSRRFMSDTAMLVILSGDKDMLQLVGRFTQQVRPPDLKRWTEATVEEKFGCKPEHLPAVMALTGDSGDNIVGVPGFGTKTACKFLAKVGWDLEALLLAPPPKIDGHQERILLNLKLVSLRDQGLMVGPLGDAPVFEPTQPDGALAPDMREFLQRYELASVLSRWEEGSLWVDPPSTLRLPLRSSSGA